MTMKAQRQAANLIWAAEDNDLSGVIQAIEGGAKINALGADLGGSPTGLGGGAAIHWAAVNGEEGMLRYLIEKGADIELKTASGKTPLLLAVQVLNVDACRVLLEAGANPNAVGDVGETPLHVVTWEMCEINGNQCGAPVLTELPKAQAIVAMLIEHGASVEIRTHAGYTVLESQCTDASALIRKTFEAVALRKSREPTPIGAGMAY